MGTFIGLILWAWSAGPVDMTAAPVFNPGICAKKRVDACGCHHVYGIRHCHARRRSDHCEAVVQAPWLAPEGLASAWQPEPPAGHEEHSDDSAWHVSL